MFAKDFKLHVHFVIGRDEVPSYEEYKSRTIAVCAYLISPGHYSWMSTTTLGHPFAYQNHMILDRFLIKEPTAEERGRFLTALGALELQVQNFDIEAKFPIRPTSDRYLAKPRRESDINIELPGE